ncbi:MAG: type II secretion system F family protein [Phycisphaeraceae bacterium]|nr:type II secretion system F family protein [Phycisphaeraceae bacterium]MCW5755107.1 type II secretion system F family protein [Phycisphaeraceae bacterium]
MPNYRYQVRASSGDVQAGIISADSAATAAALLRNQGVHILSLSAANNAGGASGLVNLLRRMNERKPTQKNVLDFTTQLAVMVRAGINLRTALEGIADQTNHAAFKRVILQLKTDVESGKQFSDAVASHPKLFNALYVNMVRASEMSGSFADMLDRIAGYIAQQLETRKMVIGASIYPGVIGTLAVAVTVFLLTFVLPKFYAVFEGKEDVLPWATTFLMNLSKFMIAQWPVLVGGLFSIIIMAFFFLRTEVGGFWTDKAKLNIPVMRGMFRSLYISRSLQTMGQLINAGVPMLDTLSITGDVSGNRMFKAMWGRVYASVKQGKKIAAPLIKDAMMPKAVCQMISAGEESGKLGEVLDQISGFYAKQLKDHIKAVTGLIEPVMILIMGTIVGFIAMAIILPIFKMSQIVS